ncbi:ABC transporter substrate-binding protein [Simiduia curdlanivorans]|uniref:Substrate-binding periplasmic protein n=1 Tax=Simiduia curdlanivorans TaxID=1492769 RepID=A0ABV8V2E2_9GAMM|nr:ABC transporter substrate-binding protein [Simiduia curdlanivorans]MDN3637971.1 ABC transporter substrate-binding protein [Simiduia curdlanivorans]
MKKGKLVLTLLLFASYFSYAESVIHIVAYDIEGLHQTDKKGKYDRVLAEVLPSEFDYKIQVAPPKRALRIFEQCSACCLSPMNDNPEFYDYAETLGAIQLPAYNSAVAYIFSQKDKMPIKDIEALAGKTIALQAGMSFGKSFIKRTKALKIATVQVSDFDSLFKMLELNRVDAVAAYTPDALLYFNNRNLTPFTYAKEHPIVIHEDALLCKNVSPEFMNKYRRNMASFSESEKFKEILEKVSD